MDTIAQLLQRGADDAAAIGAPEAVPPLRYRQLRELVQRTVAELNSFGIGRGDRVVLVLPNGPEAATAFLSIGAGATSGTCQQTFSGTNTVVLTATPNQGFTFGGWSGCKSVNGMTCTVSGAATVTATFTASLQSINHIIFLAQENRSFDSYFGAMREYWAQSGIPDQAFDGLPQFNPPASSTLEPTNPGCDPAFPFMPPNTNPYCQIDPNSPPVQSFHFKSMCVENPSPSWGESHRDWNAARRPLRQSTWCRCRA